MTLKALRGRVLLKVKTKVFALSNCHLGGLFIYGGYMSILSILSSSNYIVVNKDLIQSLGLESAVIFGVLASEADYWQKENRLDDGFFFCTVKKIREITSLSEHVQRQAIVKLQKMKLIDVKYQGLPKTRYFKVNEAQVLENFKILSTRALNFKALETENRRISNNHISKNQNKDIYSSREESAKKASIEADKLAELFNSTCVSLAKVKLLSKSRMSQVEARLKELKQTPETYVSFLQDLFARIERSDFLTNRGGLNRNNWRATFDWIFAPRNFLKVIEGNYDNKGANAIANLAEPDGWQVYFIKTYTTEALPASWADVPESKKITILKQII